MSPTPDPTETPDAARSPRRKLTRFAPLAVLLAVALAAYWAGLPHMLRPEALGREQAQLQAVAAAAPAFALAAYVLAYAVIVATCIPVALMLSLVGGVIFGPWIGSVAVLLGATGAALLTYGAARSAFAPALIARAERDPRIGRVVDGFGRNAFSYILTTRLLPFVPFGLVNIAAGLAATPVRAFAAATLVGGVPSALIYANLGAGLGSSLASDRALHDALHSPHVVASLAALTVLSLAPMLAKRLKRTS